MPTKRCSWGTCNSDSRYKHKDHMQGVTFRTFPLPSLDLLKCQFWIKMCGRPSEQLNSNKIKYKSGHHICSKHFLGDNSDPVPACPYAKQTPNRKRPRDRSSVAVSSSRKRLEADAPTVQDVPPSPGPEITQEPEPSPEIEDRPIDIHYLLEQFGIETNDDDEPKTKDATTQTEFKMSSYFVQYVIKNDNLCFHYTGVKSVKVLNLIFEWIKPVASKVKLWDGKHKMTPGKKRSKPRTKLTLFEEMILTLVRIRTGFGGEHLSYLFEVSTSHVSRIFITWVNLLEQCLSQLIIWPKRDVVEANLPLPFKRYPKTRCVIDCTEYFVQKPLRPVAQKLTWSSYKHSNTFKQLVGICPRGSVTFISKLYSGSISDAAIVKASNFIDKVEEGDDIMADRGFNIRHLLLPKKATLNIPAFSRGNTLSKKAVIRSRKIACVRIHVERAIRRMKTYKILSGVIPIRLRFLLTKISKIVAVFCNLQGSLVL